MTPDGQFLAGQNPGLEENGLPSAEDLFAAGPSASPAEVRAAVAASMGEDVPRAPRPPEYPGVHELAEGLGLA